MIIGPSRCGKSVSMSFGTEIEWQGSVLTLDLKGSHLTETAAYRRARDNDVHVFEPRARGSGHINLLDGIPFGEEEEVAAVQRVSDHLTDPGTVSQSAGAMFFRGSNRAILEAAFLFEGNYTDHRASFARTRAAMGDMSAMVDNFAVVDHPIIQAVGKDLRALPLPKRAELWKSARDCLRVFDDPRLAENTDDTTIPLHQIQHAERPQTVYIRVTPDDARGPLRSFLRLTLDQHLAKAGQRSQASDFTHYELLNLDDQFELGYLAAADHTGAYYGEHGIYLMATFQSFEQIDAYGEHSGLLDNTSTWVCFRPRHTESAKKISQKLDKCTVKDIRVSRSMHGVTRTEVLHERALMTSGEVEALPDYHAIVFTAGVPPLLTQQIPYTERPLC